MIGGLNLDFAVIGMSVIDSDGGFDVYSASLGFQYRFGPYREMRSSN